MSLPNTSPTSYNGFDFSEKVLTTACHITPTPDRAGRTTIYNKWSMTLRDWITGAPTDAAVIEARQKLTKSGGIFQYRSRVGGIAINLGKVQDVEWGPFCRGLSLVPTASGACQIEWTVEFCIPECDDATYTLSPMEYCWTLATDIDKSGYSTVTYAGFIRVPATRKTPKSRVLPDTADRLREDVTPPLLQGFRRLPGSFDLDEAKTTLRFSIQDVQLPPNVPPPGIVDCTASHTVNSDGRGFQAWVNTISASYEVAVGADPDTATRAFFALVESRRAAIKKSKTPGIAVIPWSFSASEPNLYGKTTCNFSLTYRVTASLATILDIGGLFTPVPGSDWRKWTASIATTVLGPRGIANLQFKTGDDAIVDLCAPSEVETSMSGGRGIGEETLTGRVPGGWPYPPPDQSWIFYENAFKTECDQGVVILRTLPTTTNELKAQKSGPNGISARSSNQPTTGKLLGGIGKPTSSQTPTGPLGGLGAGGAGKLINDMPEAGSKTNVQKRVSPTVFIRMVGRALRAGYPIPCPQLDNINGSPVQAVSRRDRGEGFGCSLVGNVGIPIYGAAWDLVYVVTELPEGPLPTAPNPMLDPND